VRETSFGRIVLVQITNNTGSSLCLGTFYFDYSRWFENSPKDVALYYDSGDLTNPDNILINSAGNLPVLGKVANYDDFDWSLSVLSLSDVMLADGESATFRLEVSNYASNSTSGAFDNIAITAGMPTTKAWGPSPADKATDVPRDVVISWSPGELAAQTNGHKVYFGESFDDVNDATGAVAQTAAGYAPAQRLDFGKTYYWRVDEVNAPPTNHVEFKGDVWSFTTEPIGYPIEDVNATASSALSVDTGPENTVNGSGIDADDLHSIEQTDMWISGNEPNGAWIEFEFDKVYKLHEMLVWNSNQMIESIVGFGAKGVTIEYSSDGND
ncbi:unnamed protein product, partial [marine sediment metagenome]